MNDTEKEIRIHLESLNLARGNVESTILQFPKKTPAVDALLNALNHILIEQIEVRNKLDEFYYNAI